MRRKPTALHKREGTYRPARHGDEVEFDSPESLKEPPKYLNKKAADLWRERADSLVDAGVLTVMDAAMFADLCELEAEYRAIMQKLRGKFAVDSAREDGAKVKNPLWQVARDMLQQINSMRRDFGFSPVSRTKVPTPKESEKENPFAQFG